MLGSSPIAALLGRDFDVDLCDAHITRTLCHTATPSISRRVAFGAKCRFGPLLAHTSRRKGMTDALSHTPTENLAIFERIYAIEVALRELLIDQLQIVFGPKWTKSQLPGGKETQEQLRQARVYERSTRWVQYVSHHPVYYLDFPLLRQTIERSDNWERVFKSIFVRKDVFVTALSSLEPIRNTVAHNRRASVADLAIVDGAYTLLEGLLATWGGERTLARLVKHCTLLTDLPTRLRALSEEAERHVTAMIAFRPIATTSEWRNVGSEWWFDEDYLLADLAVPRELFRLVVEYEQLPRARGEGHRIERWVSQRNLRSLLVSARSIIDSLAPTPSDER